MKNSSEFNISDIVSSDEVISGMHTPAGEAMYAVPNKADDMIEYDEECEDLLKEALGLTSIPQSLNGGEVLLLPGSPQPPGLSRELGNDEETDFFGAPEDGVSLPPEESNKYRREETNKKDSKNFFDFLFTNNNSDNEREKTNEVSMSNELNKLSDNLKRIGRYRESAITSKLAQSSSEQAIDDRTFILTYSIFRLSSKTSFSSGSNKGAFQRIFDQGNINKQLSVSKAVDSIWQALSTTDLLLGFGGDLSEPRYDIQRFKDFFITGKINFDSFVEKVQEGAQDRDGITTGIGQENDNINMWFNNLNSAAVRACFELRDSILRSASTSRLGESHAAAGESAGAPTSRFHQSDIAAGEPAGGMQAKPAEGVTPGSNSLRGWDRYIDKHKTGDIGKKVKEAWEIWVESSYNTSKYNDSFGSWVSWYNSVRGTDHLSPEQVIEKLNVSDQPPVAGTVAAQVAGADANTTELNGSDVRAKLVEYFKSLSSSTRESVVAGPLRLRNARVRRRIRRLGGAEKAVKSVISFRGNGSYEKGLELYNKFNSEQGKGSTEQKGGRKVTTYTMSELQNKAISDLLTLDVREYKENKSRESRSTASMERYDRIMKIANSIN